MRACVLSLSNALQGKNLGLFLARERPGAWSANFLARLKKKTISLQISNFLCSKSFSDNYKTHVLWSLGINLIIMSSSAEYEKCKIFIFFFDEKIFRYRVKLLFKALRLFFLIYFYLLDTELKLLVIMKPNMKISILRIFIATLENPVLLPVVFVRLK